MLPMQKGTGRDKGRQGYSAFDLGEAESRNKWKAKWTYIVLDQSDNHNRSGDNGNDDDNDDADSDDDDNDDGADDDDDDDCKWCWLCQITS